MNIGFVFLGAACIGSVGWIMLLIKESIDDSRNKKLLREEEDKAEDYLNSYDIVRFLNWLRDANSFNIVEAPTKYNSAIQKSLYTSKYNKTFRYTGMNFAYTRNLPKVKSEAYMIIDDYMSGDTDGDYSNRLLDKMYNEFEWIIKNEPDLARTIDNKYKPIFSSLENRMEELYNLKFRVDDFSNSMRIIWVILASLAESLKSSRTNNDMNELCDIERVDVESNECDILLVSLLNKDSEGNVN